MKLHYLFLLLPCVLLAQPSHLSVPFQAANGDVYIHALTGGLSNPQFSAIDLDGDGNKDLVYFDRQGFAIVPFLNTGTAGQVSYTYAPEYIYRFPKLENWMLLRDYNCDGLEDIFAWKYDINTGQRSITAYKTSRDAQNKVQFQLVKNIIKFHLKFQTQLSNIDALPGDLPAVDDIDGDGDVDILNFNSSGGYVEMFKNESQEKGWGCDSLHYVYNDNCWGRVYESGATEVIDMSPTIDSCPGYANWHPLKAARHAGSTLLTLDMNNDGDKELILGDLSFTNLTLLTNGGNPDTAFITAQEVFFPQNTTVADIDIFPAAFYVDVNNDGKKDLLAAPNIAGNAEDRKTWYYQNTGTANYPIFTYQQNDFLVNEMIDLGTGAAPTFWDYNNDGLLDIVVGNHQTFIPSSLPQFYLVLYKNIGTPTQPVYRVENTNFAGMKQYNQPRLVPSFGDLDNDGDDDLIVGAESGQLIYVMNTGTVTQPNFPNITANYALIDVGQNSTPQLVDADRDGDLDLIVGERNGNTNYFQNTGTITTPIFSNTPTTPTFGFVDTKLPGYLEGNSAPKLIDIGGTYHFFTGNKAGELWHYTNVEGNLLGTFTRVNSVLDSVDVGEESIWTIANINGDAELDFLGGNLRGGLNLFSEQVLAARMDFPMVQQNKMTLAPNPTAGSLQISFSEALNEEVSLQMVNLLGQRFLQEIMWVEQGVVLDLSGLPVGVYLLQVATEKGLFVEKVLVR